jgi:nitrogen fixation-related uncharacterized protein
MDEQLKSNLTSRHHWLRFLFMVLFAVLLQVASLVMWALVAVQFLWALISGSDNDQLRRFGHSLATFIFDSLQFLTYNTERKPFPFSEWPDLPARREEIVEVDIVDPAATTTVGDDILDETNEVVEDIKEQDELGSEAPNKARKKPSSKSKGSEPSL